MSEATSSPAGDASAPTGSGDAAVVQIANDAETAAVQFTDAPPSEWAFAAHEAALDGEAIDTIRDPEGLMPLVAAATFVAAESELFADAQDALIAMSPAVPTFETGSSAEAGETVGMVMWSGEEAETRFADEPASTLARSDAALAPYDIVSHGISLDWTDTLLSYS